MEVCAAEAQGPHPQGCPLASACCCSSFVSPHTQRLVAGGELQDAWGRTLSPRPPPPFFPVDSVLGQASVSPGGSGVDRPHPACCRRCFTTFNWLLKLKSGEVSHGSGFFAFLGDPAGLAKPCEITADKPLACPVSGQAGADRVRAGLTPGRRGPLVSLVGLPTSSGAGEKPLSPESPPPAQG